MAFIAIELRSGGRNEDRAACYSSADAAVFVLADGAGGVGSGALAAEIVLQEAQALFDGHHYERQEKRRKSGRYPTAYKQGH